MPSQVPPPSRVHPRPSAEGEVGGREESQFITPQPDRPKEGEEDFNSSLGPISLVGTHNPILIEGKYKPKSTLLGPIYFARK